MSSVAKISSKKDVIPPILAKCILSIFIVLVPSVELASDTPAILTSKIASDPEPCLYLTSR